ncbi:serine-rich adhesin for platelets-like [Haliotis asinina]|uniref:serine-rich adhesin for platelets-like n=1 Tax=Haliotis asinina TaxID=109174 RepID=UPI0035319063
MSMAVTCLHTAILTCLSVTLSGNSVDLNTTLSSVPTLASSQYTSQSPRTDAHHSIHPTRPLNVTEVISRSRSTQLTGTKMTPATKSFVTPNAAESSEETGEMSSATPTTETPKSTSTTTSTSTTESHSTTSATTHVSKAVSTSSPGISVIKTNGKMKKLSIADIANPASTTTTSADKTTTKKTKKKKRKPRKMQSTKQNQNPRSTSQKSTQGIQSKKKPVTPPNPTHTATAMGGGRSTTTPLSPEATIRVHTIDTDVKPVAFAAASDKKKNAGKGKKGSKKANKAQGKKGDRGPAGPPGPKGAKGEPGPAAQASMSMQAASSSVLTEHFGPDKDVIVPFDLKLIDLADNYDNTTGVFICTIPGVYVISLYLMSHPGAKVNARIFINSRPIAALWADDSKNSGFYPSSSIQTISRLEFGDQVYVMLVDGGYGESWVHANYNAFTLFLLYEEIFFK